MTKRTVDFTGSVSTATMRVQDLVPSFLDVLAEYWPEKADEIVHTIAFASYSDDGLSPDREQEVYNEICSDDDHGFWNSEEVSWILNEDTWDAMDEIAPKHHYFGAHPGDGADYGFWLYEDIARFLYDVEEFLHNRMSFGKFKESYRQFKNDNDIELAELKELTVGL